MMKNFQCFARIRTAAGRDLEYARHTVRCETEEEAMADAEKERMKNPDHASIYISHIECWD